MGNLHCRVIVVLLLLSNKRSIIGGTVRHPTEFFIIQFSSIKQCVEPESTSARNFKSLDTRLTDKEQELERTDVLSLTDSVGAQVESTQPSVCAEPQGLSGITYRDIPSSIFFPVYLLFSCHLRCFPSCVILRCECPAAWITPL